MTDPDAECSRQGLRLLLGAPTLCTCTGQGYSRGCAEVSAKENVFEFTYRHVAWVAASQSCWFALGEAARRGLAGEGSRQSGCGDLVGWMREYAR